MRESGNHSRRDRFAAQSILTWLCVIATLALAGFGCGHGRDKGVVVSGDLRYIRTCPGDLASCVFPEVSRFVFATDRNAELGKDEPLHACAWSGCEFFAPLIAAAGFLRLPEEAPLAKLLNQPIRSDVAQTPVSDDDDVISRYILDL